jgi:hypothetical protein
VHLEHDCGLTVFQHACKMGLEDIVSKRLGSTYRSGRSPDWQWQTGRAYRAFRSLETTEAPQRMKIAPSWSGPSEQNQESAGVSNRGTVLPIPSFGSTCPSANISLVVRACHRHHSTRLVPVNLPEPFSDEETLPDHRKPAWTQIIAASGW